MTGTRQATPVITVAGAVVALGAGTTAPTAVDRLQVSWGSDEMFGQPDPATATLTLFDPTSTWATSRDLIGAECTAGWVGAGDPTKAGTFFRGRILRARVFPHRAAGVLGSLVELQLTSTITDLANRVPTAAWPAETFAARQTRIAAAAAPTVSAVTMAPGSGWQDRLAPLAPVAAKDQASVLDHLIGLYETTGVQRFSFDPGTRAVTGIGRRRYVSNESPPVDRSGQPVPTPRGLAGLTTDPTGARIGVYPAAYPVAPALPLPTNPGEWLSLDAGGLAYDPGDGVTRGADQRISRVRYSWSNPADGYNDVTAEYLIPDVDEATVGERTVSFDTALTDPTWIGLDLAGAARWEGRAWQLQPLTWRTGLFDSWTQAAALLAGRETADEFLIQRSWLPAYGIRPVSGIRGGQIGFSDGAWDLELALAPVTTEDVPQHAISWSEIDDGTTGHTLRWYDDDQPDGMHSSLTLDDLGSVATGWGVTAVPYNPDWDSPLS